LEGAIWGTILPISLRGLVAMRLCASLTIGWVSAALALPTPIKAEAAKTTPQQKCFLFDLFILTILMLII
jgi:hypothetical protein